ncbi:MAG: phosphatidylserine decarboxylase family protein [Bacteroidetes bacterium]|nr:phosphatidylserine decarboxylase family protein [Bacteroidota bacterium]
MRLTRFGRDVILKVFILVFLLTLSALFVNSSVYVFAAVSISALLWIFTLYFFRDPERKLPDGYKLNQLLSPGDGKVVVIENITNTEKNIFEKGEELIQISIFLSPLNVHVNRIPLTGEVKYLNYIKGDYIVAFDHKSSERNERSEIGIEDNMNGNKVLFKQIAGFVARRIVYDIKNGDRVTAGDRFGMIKFGSRIDILISKSSNVLVKIDQKVTGGETIIAEF